jgi:transposase
VYDRKDIILAVDYHAENIEIRWFNCASGEERCLNIPTTRSGILRLVEKTLAEASEAGGKVIWIMESTTGWARVKELIGSRVHFIMANVLQMPLPPKAYRRKSDKIDTGRMLREFLNGSLPQSYQPEIRWRELRRLVDSRQDLVERQTAVKNWISHFLHHETWAVQPGTGCLRTKKVPAPWSGDSPASIHRPFGLLTQHPENMPPRLPTTMFGPAWEGPSREPLIEG